MSTAKYKVESANLRVSNVNDEAREYTVAANFNTMGSELQRVEAGAVTTLEGVQLASFYTGFQNEKSLTITYYGEAKENAETQCSVNGAINTFIEEAVAIAVAEAEEEN